MAGRKRKILTGSKRELFMKMLTETAVVRTACAAVGISYTTAYVIRKKDEQFAKDWDAALGSSIMLLEDEMIRRGVYGWHEPVYQRGRLVGTILKKSDKMLALALQALKPRVYRQNVKVGNPTPAINSLQASAGLNACTTPGQSVQDYLALVKGS